MISPKVFCFAGKELADIVDEERRDEGLFQS